MLVGIVATLVVAVLILFYLIYKKDIQEKKLTDEVFLGPIEGKWVVEEAGTSMTVDDPTCRLYAMKKGSIVVLLMDRFEFKSSGTTKIHAVGVLPPELRPNDYVELLGRGHTSGSQVVIWYTIYPDGTIKAAPIRAAHGSFQTHDSHVMYKTALTYYVGPKDVANGNQK